MPKDTVRSLYQCEAIHGGYSRCTGIEGHDGPHSNASYTWTDKPTAEQKANFVEMLKNGRTAKGMGSKDSKES